MKTDVLVLGAGMVGISAAVHLAKRGRSVMLVDRRGAAEETSYGNAGIIQREAVAPYFFPRELGEILRHALGRGTEAHYHLATLPRIAPALFAYWRNSTPERAAVSTRANIRLVERCLAEHEALMAEAGVAGMLRRTGYMKLYRSAARLDKAREEQNALKAEYGVAFEALDGEGVRRLEPHIAGPLAGALHMPEPCSVADPSALGKAYVDLLIKLGGQFRRGEARTLSHGAEGWSVATADGKVTAKNAVVALGPWSDAVTRPLGYRFPLFVKRGYHRHFKAKGNAGLSRPVVDVENGFALAPASAGIRVTTGAEFTVRDAPATPVQLAHVEPLARGLFPLETAIEAVPWLGRRPCLPDMLPIIGRAPRHDGLWLDFGHHHLGFTLGPVTGRLLSEMMTGETPFTDPAPFRAERFV